MMKQKLFNKSKLFIGMLLLLSLFVVACSSTETSLDETNSPAAVVDDELLPQRNEGAMPEMGDDDSLPQKDEAPLDRPAMNEDEMAEDMPPTTRGERPPGEQEIPLEAIDACDGLEEGDSCTISSPRGDMSGTCSFESDVLACAP